MSSNPLKLANVTKPGTNGQQVAVQQISYSGKVGDAAMSFPYGYHSNIPPDYLIVTASMQSDSDARVAIGCLPKKKPTLAEGEVALYHPPTDAFIIWRKTGDLEIETGGNGTANINIKGTSVNIAADVNITGDVNVTGNTAFVGTVEANGKSIDDTHGHSQSNDSAGDSQSNIAGVL